MAGAVGREIVAAFKKYSTWRTVSGAPGAGFGAAFQPLIEQAAQAAAAIGKTWYCLAEQTYYSEHLIDDI